MVETNFPKLDAREGHFRIPSHRSGLSLFLRYFPPLRETEPRGNVVLYVHGGTFPSGLSIAHRFDGRSWRDELAASGFHCWGSTSTASAVFPIPISKWRSRPKSMRRSAVPRTQATSSNRPSVLFAPIIALTGFR